MADGESSARVRLAELSGGKGGPLVVQLSRGLAAGLNLPVKRPAIEVRVGGICTSALLSLAGGEDTSIRMSSFLLNLLHIPVEATCNARWDSVGNCLSLGPVIGVFVSAQQSGRLFFGRTERAHEKVLSIARGLGAIAYLFSLLDIDWGRGLIRGWTRTLSPEGVKWCSSIRPFPDVIYDRSLRRAEAITLRELMEKEGNETPLFNAMPKLCKWETMEILRQCDPVKDILPETILYRDASSVLEMLSRYDAVYLKPDDLSRGQGVFRVSRLPGGRLRVEYRDHPVNRVEDVNSGTELNRFLAPYRRQDRNYIVQQRIDLAEHGGVPFDIRALVQKDITGRWAIGGIVARLAAEGSVITSPRSGGSVAPISLALNSAFPGSASGLQEQVEARAIEIAECIERRYRPCGEIGLDMGIDKNGRIWLIEANGKPLKVSLERLGDPAAEERMYRLPVEFCFYLAGFGGGDSNARGAGHHE
ncbi:MAG: YheC/YheD family protein [Syntrophothermus sp.]